LRTLEVANDNAGIIMAIVMPVLMLCWGYAIWGFIKTGRLNDEIKYLDQMEYAKLLTNASTKD